MPKDQAAEVVCMMEEVSLNRLQVTAQTVLSREAVTRDAITLDVLGNEMSNLVYRLRSEVLAEHTGTINETRYIQVPRNWWQMLKRDCLPRWFRRRWPVKCEDAKINVTCDVWAKYPHLAEPPPRAPEFGQPIRYLTVRVVSVKPPAK